MHEHISQESHLVRWDDKKNAVFCFKCKTLFLNLSRLLQTPLTQKSKNTAVSCSIKGDLSQTIFHPRQKGI